MRTQGGNHRASSDLDQALARYVRRDYGESFRLASEAADDDEERADVNSLLGHLYGDARGRPRFVNSFN